MMPRAMIEDRVPQWGPAQKAVLVLLSGSYFLGVLFYQMSAAPGHQVVMRYLADVAREVGDQPGVRRRESAAASLIKRLRIEAPAEPVDAWTELFAWQPTAALRGGRLWQPVTYALLHDPRPMGFWSFLNTVAVVILLGGFVENRLGPWRIVGCLAGGAVAGAAGAALMNPSGHFIGPDAGLLALIVVFVLRAPLDDLRIGRGEIPARRLGLGLALTTVLCALFCSAAPDMSSGEPMTVIGGAGLLAGAAWGFAFHRFEPRVFEWWLGRVVWRRRRLRADEARIRRKLDVTLDKLNTCGYNALSRRERAFLRSASRFLKRLGRRAEKSDTLTS